jgi:hypothetical protein
MEQMCLVFFESPPHVVYLLVHEEADPCWAFLVLCYTAEVEKVFS